MVEFSVSFLGVGGAFTLPEIPGDLFSAPMQSNMVLTAPNGERLLIDCGTDIRYSAQMCGLTPASFSGVYISHLHADHIGGLEWFLLNRFFSNMQKPLLIAHTELIHPLWRSLEGGLKVTTEGVVSLKSYVRIQEVSGYYDCQGRVRHTIGWKGLRLQLVKHTHVPNLLEPMQSYGLLITGEKNTVYISSDTVFCQKQIVAISEVSDILFQDCEVGFKTGVHAHYDELCSLPSPVKAKMWLYHYNPIEARKMDPKQDGFLGFVSPRQNFSFN